jgi:hypothetical protein
MSDKSLWFTPQPTPMDAGFRMKEYHVWCGSPTKVDGTYHLFASRWPIETGFPQGYMAYSEVVRASSESPIGPYRFEEVVLPKREGYWDGNMTHNPTIHRVGDTFVLYYNANAEPGGIRKVGYATAPDVSGPWTRLNDPIPLSEDANNPAALFADDGSLLLAFRDRDLHMGIATAPLYHGPYTVHDFDLFPDIKLEDMFLFRQDDGVHMICEDNRAQISGHERWGVHLFSEDGISNWRKTDPLVIYDHDILWEDGTRLTATRRERPQLLCDDEGVITHLATGVLADGHAWNHMQPVTLTS